MGRAGMLLVESEVPDLVRAKYEKLRPDWKILDISLVARKFGGFMAVVVCENVTEFAPEGVARFADEVCYISPKGEVTWFTDIASFANFLIWWERRSIFSKWLTVRLGVRCLLVVALVGSAFKLDVALEGGSTILAAAAAVIVVSASLGLLLQSAE